MSDLQRDLEECLAKIDRLREKQFAAFMKGGHTRATTTTRNANIDKIQERVVWLREEIRRQANGSHG